MRFRTDFRFNDRFEKSEYVWLKYKEILKGDILDVGADRGHLRQHLAKDTAYTSIGLGGTPDRKIDLEREAIPFPDNSFDCVLCLDVLEHLDNLHAVFDRLCQLSRRYVIISLPNAWASLWHMFCTAEYKPGQPTKFYGLPLEKPDDRHKWFFSDSQARAFIAYRSSKNGMRVVQLDNYQVSDDGPGLQGIIRKFARRLLLRNDLNPHDLHADTLWAVLEKTDRSIQQADLTSKHTSCSTQSSSAGHHPTSS